MIDPIHAAASRLQDALIALSTATDARGLNVVLVRKPRDLDEVRHALHNMARWFQPDSVFVEDGEQNAARNIALVAELLRALLAYKAAGGKDGLSCAIHPMRAV